MQTNHSVGYDSFKFIIVKSSFYKALKKWGLFEKMRSTTRNKSVDKFVKDKFKKAKTKDKLYPFKVRYINIKPRNKSLSNTILAIEHSKDCFELAKRHKKAKDYYIEVQFNGLYQPSKSVDAEVFKVLSKMIKRFKAYSVDVACDFDDELAVSKAREYAHAQRFKRVRIDGELSSFKTSIYINEPVSEFYSLKRVLIYDKYEKQTHYHKEKLKDGFRRWKRLELTLQLKAKFLDKIENDVNAALSLMQDYLRLLDIWHFNMQVILEQTRYLNNPRHAKSFTPYALAS